MSKSDAFEMDLLRLLFNGTPIPNIADNAAASPLANLYVSLHTADPGDAGTQATNEVVYTGYARAAVPRTAAAWPVTQVGGVTSVSPSGIVSFPAATGGNAVATFFGVGTSASGAGKLLYSGTLNPPITCQNGVTPQYATNSTISED